MSRDRLSWVVPVVLALVSLLVSSFVAYSHEREDLKVGVAVTAALQKTDRERLERLEQKVDEILKELRKR